MDWRWQIGMMLLAAHLVCGCATSRTCPETYNDAPIVLDCHVVPRGTIAPELSGIPPRSEVVFNDDRLYCNLPEREAHCLAATNSSLARLLEGEAAALDAQPKGLHHKKDSGERAQAILRLQAAHERNRSASAALQVFMRLVEAEGGAGNARLRSLEVNRLLTDVQRLQVAGAESTLSLSTVQAQQVELVHKQVEVEATIEQLNHQLVKLLGAEPPPDTRLWPDANLTVDPALPSAPHAYAAALRQRADLAALRLAACSSDAQMLEMSRALLSKTGAGLGIAMGPCALLSAFHPKSGKREAGVRQEQLCETLAEQERMLQHDIAQTVATIEARVVQIALTQRRLEMLQHQHERLERKRQIDATAGFESRKAKLDALAVEQDLLHDVVEWKIAVIKLAELQGDLAIMCGFTAALECD